MAREIFISYSRWNLEQVKAIKSEIEQATGAECWMDLNAIESGATQFTQDIVDGINTCPVFLFMLSKESQASKFALGELNLASKKAEKNVQKHVVIVNIDGCEMCDSFYLLYSLADTIAWQNQPQKEKLLRDLKRWTEQEKEHQRKLRELDGVELKPIERGGKFGFADETGKVVIPCQWESAGSFSEGLAAVKDDKKKWGFIDKTGTVMIPFQWDEVAYFFSEGLAPVKDDKDKWGFIDKTGILIIPCQWKTAAPFLNGVAVVLDADWKWWFIDKTGKVVGKAL